MSSTCTVHKGQVCRTDDDDDDLVSSWSVLRGYIKLAVIFATCPSAPALPARLAHWYWNSAVTGVRGPHGGWGSPGVNSGEYVPLFFSPSLSSPENWIPFVSSEVSLSSHSCLGLFQNEQNGSGWWGRGARNKLRTHTHIYTLSHTHTATARPFSKPTDKCTTLSHYSPINIGATAANSCWAERTNMTTADISPPLATVRGRGGNPASIPAQIHSQPRKRWHIFLHPPTTAIPICEPSWAELRGGTERGEGEEERKKKSDIYLTGGNLLAAFGCIGNVAARRSPRALS